jgi:hypothetical protein
LNYIGAGTVSVLGFLLATACGQGGSGGGPPGPPGDEVPGGYEDPPPVFEDPAVVDPAGDEDFPPPNPGTIVPDNSGDPPPGGGAGCSQFCGVLVSSGCFDGGAVSNCVAECNTEIITEPCGDLLLDAAACLFGLITSDNCETEELDENEILASCSTQVLRYGECSGQITDGGEPTPMQTCTCVCSCEYGCTGTTINSCAAAQAQECALCDTECDDYCFDQDCGLTLTPPTTAAYCSSAEQ